MVHRHHPWLQLDGGCSREPLGSKRLRQNRHAYRRCAVGAVADGVVLERRKVTPRNYLQKGMFKKPSWARGKALGCGGGAHSSDGVVLERCRVAARYHLQ